VPASPHRPNGHAEHAVGDLIEAGRSLHRAGRLEDAERLYAEALAQDAECAEAHELLAVLAGQRGQFDAAIAGFRRAVALAGLTPQRCYNLAEAHRLAGDFPSAVAAYNQALALDAGFFDAYRDCADAAKDEAAKARSAGESEAAVRFDKLAAHYLKGLALALFRADRQAETVAAYGEAISLDPENADLHNMLGVELDNQRRLPEAEAALRRAIELDPSSPGYLNNLGVVLARQGRNDEAAELFRRALAIDPEFEDAQKNLSGLT
jgi:Flp pilus assembly protein TadD